MRLPLLALIARGPAHGYELKSAYEAHFGAVLPPVNIGQVYTTLSRLERDGLVTCFEVEQEDRPNKRVYTITPAGHEALRTWLEESSPRPRLRDDFLAKLVLAGAAALADPQELLDRQRAECLAGLRELDQISRSLGVKASLAERLAIESAALHLEADLKWLDFAEEQIQRRESP